MPPPLQIGWYGPSSEQWGWIQSNFERLTHLDLSRVEEWCTPTKRNDRNIARKLLFVALEHRVDLSSIEAILRQSTSAKTIVALLLGNDWHGHRRTYPLPEGIPTFYWYQWFDQVFPWISELNAESNDDRETRSKSKNAASPSDMNLAWRVRWGLDRSRWLANIMKSIQLDGLLAWLVTDHSDQTSLWQDACRPLGIRLISSRVDRDSALFEPELIIVDSLARSEDSLRSIESTILSIRRRHSQACLAVATTMPTWEQWYRWQACGVDAILPRPALLQGFLFYWHLWNTRLPVPSA